MSTKDKEDQSTTIDLKSKDESQETKIKEESNSSKQKKEKDNAEEEEEEIEVEEEVEEKDDEEEESEDEGKNEKETETEVNILPQKTKDGLEVSMDESDEGICDFINEKGLPMEVKDEQTLALILYFHKLCVPFFKILNSLKKKNIQKIFLSSLKESYFLFADVHIKQYNFKSIAKKVFPNIKKSEEEFLISFELNNTPLSEPIVPTPSVFKINQKILE